MLRIVTVTLICSTLKSIDAFSTRVPILTLKKKAPVHRRQSSSKPTEKTVSSITSLALLDSNVLHPSKATRREILLASLSIIFLPVKSAVAAPPVAIIAEELGYFPVTNRDGKTTYIPARVKRSSTDQSIALAEYLKKSKAVMYGSFWCPHCKNQKELFGREAWESIRYVECDPRGANGDAALCLREGVDGFPAWTFGNGKTVSGEASLERLAAVSGFKGKFDATLEGSIVPSASGSCR